MHPRISVGKYRTMYEIYGHLSPGLSLYDRKLISPGKEVQIGKILYLKYSIWGKCEYGWVCIYMNQKFYLERIGS